MPKCRLCELEKQAHDLGLAVTIVPSPVEGLYIYRHEADAPVADWTQDDWQQCWLAWVTMPRDCEVCAQRSL